MSATNATPDRIELHEHFDCTQQELWDAITDGRQLSSWFGGTCALEPTVGGAVRFDLPADGVVATGEVRAVHPPTAGYTVAHLEHTFVERGRDDLAAVCGWAVVIADEGCDLHFSMDGAGEVASSLGPTEERIPTEHAVAEQAFDAAHTILLVDWVLDEIPATLVRSRPHVLAKVGPKPDDWAVLEADSSERGYSSTRIPRPDHADLLHLDWTLGFDDFVDVARQLGVTTFWYHSARTRPPQPADNRGCWVPARQSNRQRAIVESAGMTYIDGHYIVDIARRGAGEPSGA